MCVASALLVCAFLAPAPPVLGAEAAPKLSAHERRLRESADIAGIVIAFLTGVLDRVNAFLTTWSTAHNPFFNGLHADALALIPFAVLTGFLYLVAREKLLAPKPHQPGMES